MIGVSMSIRWTDIRPLQGSQHHAFEELVCQLAREEPIENKKEFYRVAAPDGGVEAYCVLENGEEYGWQAKYFFSMDNGQWQQIKESFETALKTHPKLIRYYVCIPLDRTDARNGKQHFMDKWNKKILEWTDHAKQQGRTITFEYWGSSELLHRLSHEKHAGRRLFWFAKEEFSDSWFERHIEKSIADLGVRYSAELNVELDIAKYFDALSRNDRFRELLKQTIHSFLKSFYKLDKEFLQQEIVQNFIALLKNQCQIVESSELTKFDINAIEHGCDSVDKLLSDEYQKIANHKKTLSTTYLDKVDSALFEFRQFINSPIMELADLPVLVLSGEAGVGKSHLLADIVSKKQAEEKASILLLGQHFVSEESPWTQILNNLSRPKCSEQELLEALNAKAQAQGERLLFIVDAINEGKGRSFWDNHIRSFIQEFSKYTWLGLVLSVRTSYENLLIPQELISGRVVVRIEHRGFEDVEYDASSQFFSHYELEQPSIPLLHPEFTNPLFLKLFCEGLQRSGQKRIPKGYSGITKILDVFLNSVDEKLSHPSLFDYQPATGKKLVRKVINALITYKLEHQLSSIPYESAIDVANPIVSRFSHRKDFVDNLVAEGVLSKNLFRRENDEYEERIYFAYERFGDHFAADYLLEKYLDRDNPEIAFQDGGALAQYISESYRYQGITEAWSIQLPEKIDRELYELVSDQRKPDKAIVKAFINSLIWRRPETIKEKVLDYVNYLTHLNGYPSPFDLFFQTVYSVFADPDHLFNSNGLHRFLMSFSLADRDALWTIYLHDKDYQGSAMQRLIDWARRDGGKNYLSVESRLLAGKALAWLFPSTNIKLRDSATQALVCLLENNISVICELLVDFRGVNDPYIYERILAAAYGAVLRSENLNELTQLADIILKDIFLDKEEVYPNVLVRDYARNIIEFAVYKQLFQLENPQVIRPPYKSQLPDRFPNNEEIDAYKSEDEKYWGRNKILWSMTTEYGRGMCNYGDFGRYTFESALRHWKYKFDANDLSNYACQLIFEKYGYDAEKHGEFDHHASAEDRHTHTKERIGKKYQWLALYEVLARVADNAPMEDESTSWQKGKKYDENSQLLMDNYLKKISDETKIITQEELDKLPENIWEHPDTNPIVEIKDEDEFTQDHIDNEYVQYQGTWQLSIRNIDPTFGEFRSKPQIDAWWNPIQYDAWKGDSPDWLSCADDLPDFKKFIEFIDPQGNEWLALEMHPYWKQPVPLGCEQSDHPHKRLWCQIRSYFVPEKQANKIITWAKQQNFMGRWFPESHDLTGIFAREYYWSPAYQFFNNNSYYDSSDWKMITNRSTNRIVGKVMVTTERHLWEKGVDESVSYLAPKKCLFDKLQLQYSKNIGEWKNHQGEVICFDPTIHQDENNCLLIKKSSLLKCLKESRLKIFWTCLGQKQFISSSIEESHRSKWLEFSGVFELVSGTIIGKINE